MVDGFRVYGHPGNTHNKVMPILDELVPHPPHLPATHALSDIAAAVRPGNYVMITAPLGMGKITLLPPVVTVALAQHSAAVGRVPAAQPRRVAARAVARRIARLLDKEISGQIGYSVRGDSCVGERIHVEMMMPGVTLHHLQRDPEPPGVPALTTDEFHERNPDAGLTLAFTLDARSALRNGLFAVLTSATSKASRTVDFPRASTGEELVLANILGDIFPLELRYASPPHGAEAMGTIENGCVDMHREHLAHMTRTARGTVAAAESSVLVSLPRVGEIETVRDNLCLGGIPVLTLCRQLSAIEQGCALSPTSSRRTILSTSIAGSSPTVPGVSVVTDAELARESYFGTGRSLSSLVTVSATLTRLEQRTGHTAHTSLDAAVCVIGAMDMARRPAQSAPDTATQGLADTYLRVVSWGIPVKKLSLFDVPLAGT